MTGTNWTVNSDSSTDASFRAWGSAISNALSVLGFVQTSDTGQINWSTVAHPTAGSTAAGYEIWRFNDALQASAPIFFKIEYGTGNGTVPPSIWITVGSSSDGAGNITALNIPNQINTIAARRQCVYNASTMAAQISTSYAAGDGSALMLALWPASTTSGTPCYLVIERTRNWDGTANGDGYMVINGNQPGGSGAYFVSYLPGTALVNNTSTNYMGSGYVGNNQTSMPLPKTCNINNQVWPVGVITGLIRLSGFSQYIMFVCAGDLARASTFAMSHYGVSRNWYATGDSQGTPHGQSGSNLNSAILRID